MTVRSQAALGTGNPLPRGSPASAELPGHFWTTHLPNVVSRPMSQQEGRVEPGRGQRGDGGSPVWRTGASDLCRLQTPRGQEPGVSCSQLDPQCVARCRCSRNSRRPSEEIREGRGAIWSSKMDGKNSEYSHKRKAILSRSCAVPNFHLTVSSEAQVKRTLVLGGLERSPRDDKAHLAKCNRPPGLRRVAVTHLS